LSNRFGAGPVTFERATVARRESGAALVPGTVRGLTFRGLRSATVAPGDDVVSDPVQLNFGAYRKSLAVSVYVPSNVGKPTEHYTARQTSYLTPEGAGDKTSDLSGSPFTEETTTRPFVIGIDVRRQPGFGGVVTLGDSFTDGYQGRPTGPLEAQEGIDADGRWPDVLGRRLRAADIPLSVMNAGISGNRVLRDGEEGGNLDTYGPSALHRLRHDVLRQPGVTTVILLEGGNDLGLEPNATVAELEAGYRELIRRMHVAGLHVLQGTLTPMVGGMGDYGTAEANRKRNRINSWIRNESPAEGVIDVARVVRDPNDASRIRPAYDSGDHLHLNLAGYRAVGQAVPLGQLR
jgi:lysophospholipase L1-like esterase